MIFLSSALSSFGFAADASWLEVWGWGWGVWGVTALGTSGGNSSARATGDLSVQPTFFSASRIPRRALDPVPDLELALELARKLELVRLRELPLDLDRDVCRLPFDPLLTVSQRRLPPAPLARPRLVDSGRSRERERGWRLLWCLPPPPRAGVLDRWGRLA